MQPEARESGILFWSYPRVDILSEFTSRSEVIVYVPRSARNTATTKPEKFANTHAKNSTTHLSPPPFFFRSTHDLNILTGSRQVGELITDRKGDRWVYCTGRVTVNTSVESLRTARWIGRQNTLSSVSYVWRSQLTWIDTGYGQILGMQIYTQTDRYT